MLGVTSAQVQADRFGAAERLVARTGAVVVLKGSRTIIASPAHPPCVCPTGTPAMAVAGSGDVLAGVIGALLGQVPAFEAGCAAVYLHGLAGERASTGDRGMLASELAAQLPSALVACRG
jgi:NAD(P)H-hydrate epimerase